MTFGSDVANTKIQPASAIRLGNGYNHIRYVPGGVAPRLRRSVSAPICAMNCTRIRVVMSTSITNAREKKLQAIDTAPTTRSEMYGNGFLGCRRPKALKK